MQTTAKNHPMTLTIVIPAFNEEQAIASIIERTLDAREHILAGAAVDDVEIIVVSDGSTDRTAEIAQTYTDIRLIVFEQNRGYGAAIKRGFEAGRGDLVGFLDADGTCDPRFFATLCQAIHQQNAHVAIGSRLGSDSRMPRIRRVGNRFYAFLLGLLSNRHVTDTASGMRVIRRDALETLYPLPDGLNFTPAMSARVLMDDRLKLVECPMSYRDRVGESKLSVVRDGVRFLQTIGQMTLVFRPVRLFLGASIACLLITMILAMHPIETYLRMGHLDEGMIYRLLFCSFVGSVGIMLLAAGVIGRAVVNLIDETPNGGTYWETLPAALFSGRGVMVVVLLLVGPMVWLIGPGIWTRITDGRVTLHWSRVVLAGLMAFGAVQLIVATLIRNLIEFHLRRRGMPPLRQESADATSLTPHAPLGTHTTTPTPPGTTHKPTRQTEPRPSGSALGCAYTSGLTDTSGPAAP